jgi:hypothetical protein
VGRQRRKSAPQRLGVGNPVKNTQDICDGYDELIWTTLKKIRVTYVRSIFECRMCRVFPSLVPTL